MLRTGIFTTILCFSCVVIANSITLVDVLAKVVNLCQQRYQNVNLIDCVKERSLFALDNAYRSKSEINIIPDFISLTKYDSYKIEERSAKILPEDLEKQNSQNKSHILDNLLKSRLRDFLGSRVLNVKIPITCLDVLNLVMPENNEEDEEGRGKKEKGGLLPMFAMMAGSMLIFKMTALAVIASKALMASVIAMMLSAIAAFSKKGVTHGSTYEVINVPAQGHHSRRLYGDAAAYSNQYHRGEPVPNEPIEVDNNM